MPHAYLDNLYLGLARHASPSKIKLSRKKSIIRQYSFMKFFGSFLTKQKSYQNERNYIFTRTFTLISFQNFYCHPFNKSSLSLEMKYHAPRVRVHIVCPLPLKGMKTLLYLK